MLATGARQAVVNAGGQRRSRAASASRTAPPGGRDERGERVDRAGVGPVEVVEPEDERAGAGQAFEEVAQRPVHAMAVDGDRLAEHR